MYLPDTNILLELLLDQEKLMRWSDSYVVFHPSAFVSPNSPSNRRALPFFGADVMMPSCEQWRNCS